MSKAIRVFVDGSTWELVRFDGDEEPRVRDLDLADRLGFERPVAIRKLIQRHMVKLREFGVISTVETTSGVSGGRPGTEYWLNRKQAIFVTMKSETERAADLQVAIVHVFDAVVFDGQAAVNTKALAEIQAKLVALEQHQDEQRNNLAALWSHVSQGGYIARARFEALQQAWRQLADVEVLAGRWPKRSSAIADILRDMRDSTDWGGKGKPWRELPAALEPAARAVLNRRMADATRRQPKRQLSLVKTG